MDSTLVLPSEFTVTSKHFLTWCIYLLSCVTTHNQSRNTLREMSKAFKPIQTQLIQRTMGSLFIHLDRDGITILGVKR